MLNEPFYFVAIKVFPSGGDLEGACLLNRIPAPRRF